MCGSDRASVNLPSLTKHEKKVGFTTKTFCGREWTIFVRFAFHECIQRPIRCKLSRICIVLTWYRRDNQLTERALRPQFVTKTFNLSNLKTLFGCENHNQVPSW